jgi:hypothetical protein
MTTTRAVLDTIELEEVSYGHDMLFPTRTMAFHAACYDIRHGDYAVSTAITKFQLRHDPVENADVVWAYTPNDPGDDGDGWHSFPLGIERTDGGWHIAFVC